MGSDSSNDAARRYDSFSDTGDASLVPEAPRSLVGEASSRPLVATIGQVLAGKYEVVRLIGQGGMGLVVEAHQRTLDRRVALKLLSPRAREDGEAVERFLREAKAAAKIRSEHVGRVLDVDALDGGEPFIVMELLEGRDLAAELTEVGKVEVERAATIVLQACEAIAEAHAVGIVHRDLKPANLFLAHDAAGKLCVKVLDFGISKITLAESPDRSQAKALTSASAMLGSPLYMSPEQMRASGEVDKRTDVWSLGVILYEMIVGKSPFDASSVPMVCANVISAPMPPLEQGEHPEGLEPLLQRCLAKDPDERYRDVHHLARALARYAPRQAKVSLAYIESLKTADGEPASAPTPSLLPPPPDGALTATNWGNVRGSRPARKRWPLALAATSLVAAGAAIFALGAATRGADEQTRPAARGHAPAPESLPPRAESSEAPIAEAPPAAPSAPAPAEPSASAQAALGAEEPEPPVAVASASAKPATAPARPHRPRPAPTGEKRTAGFGDRD